MPPSVGTEYIINNIKCLTALILKHLWGLGGMMQLNSQLKVINMKKETVEHWKCLKSKM